MESLRSGFQLGEFQNPKSPKYAVNKATTEESFMSLLHVNMSVYYRLNQHFVCNQPSLLLKQLQDRNSQILSNSSNILRMSTFNVVCAEKLFVCKVLI